jgi:hypothetical protein
MSVNEGKWSDEFGLEAVGTTSMLHCFEEHKKYNFLMRITMSNSSRAKLITFAPFLSIVNNLDAFIFIREWHRNEKYVSKFNWKPIESVSDNSTVNVLIFFALNFFHAFAYKIFIRLACFILVEFR